MIAMKNSLSKNVARIAMVTGAWFLIAENPVLYSGVLLNLEGVDCATGCPPGISAAFPGGVIAP
jgi:hypothetical protein